MTSLVVPSWIAIMLMQTAAGTTADTNTPAPAIPQSMQNPDVGSDSYWTPERMRTAKPFPLPKVDAGGNEPAPPRDESGPEASAPGSPPASPKR